MSRTRFNKPPLSNNSGDFSSSRLRGLISFRVTEEKYYAPHENSPTVSVRSGCKDGHRQGADSQSGTIPPLLLGGLQSEGESGAGTTVGLAAAIHSATGSCGAKKNRVLSDICRSFPGSSEQLRGEALLVGEGTRGAPDEGYGRKRARRHRAAPIAATAPGKQSASSRGFSENKAGHEQCAEDGVELRTTPHVTHSF